MTFKYEVGDEFKNPYGTPRRVLARKESNAGLKMYWLEVDGGEACTWVEADLDNWTKVEPFFKVGDTFQSPWDHVATMTVTHVDGVVKSAWVTVTSEDNSPRKETIGEVTWRHVKDEILKNRSN